jgi:hypothetical protein
MTSFFVDLWHDLREKRLWPVAVGLLAAIVAVPVILFKPASDAAPDSAVAPRTPSAETLPVVAVDSGPTQGSKLEAFNQKNPFKPMKDLAKQKSAAGSGSSGSGSGAGGGLGASDASAGGGSTTVSGGSGGSSTGGTSAGGGSTGGSSTPSAPGIPTVEWFRYAADFTFGESGKLQKFKGPASFTMLPDDQKPAIVYLGISDDAKSAVFLISDPAFEAAGEGKCAPKAGPCQFVSLKLSDTNDEETFTSIDGSVSYELKLNNIRREKLETDSNGNPVPPAKSKPGAAAADAGSGAGSGDPVAQATAGAVPELFAGGPGFARERR